MGLALARRRRLRYAISLAAFLLPFLAFTNLHVIHNYYAYGSGLFLLVASGWAIEGALEAGIGRRVIAYGLLVACLAISVFGYYRSAASLCRRFLAGRGKARCEHAIVLA